MVKIQSAKRRSPVILDCTFLMGVSSMFHCTAFVKNLRSGFQN